VDATKPGIGHPDDVRRWAVNRRIANAVEVRELRTTWNTTDRSFAAALQLLALYAAVNGWPPPDDPVGRRETAAVRDRFVRLRNRLRT
jgi:hypothetical protein